MNSNRIVSLFLVVLFTSASGFASENSAPKDKDKKPAENHRGWIGGEYRLARRHWNWFDTTDAVIAFPRGLTNTQKGVLITALATNTPAYLAGLRETDLILEFDHEKIASLAAFRKKIDRATPGSTLALRAYRDGEMQDYNVTVGRETFRDGGAFAVGLFYDLPSFKFNPSFSLIAVGLSCEGDKRTELGSAEEVFRRENVKDHYPSDTYWRAWVGPLIVMRTREIRSQEIVTGESLK
jgi:membrane-associated protease RseP (regulator of RpoE activity)